MDTTTTTRHPERKFSLILVSRSSFVSLIIDLFHSRNTVKHAYIVLAAKNLQQHDSQTSM